MLVQGWADSVVQKIRARKFASRFNAARVERAIALRWILDAVMVFTVALTFAGAADPDVLFHVVWLALIVQSFTLPSLLPVVIRVVAASACLIAYRLVPLIGADDPRDFADWALLLLMLSIVAVMAEHRRQTSRRFAGLYRMASDHLLTAQESERKHLARDLHDGVGQTLSSLAFTLEAASLRLGPDHKAAAQINTARELVALAAEETRTVAGRLQPPRLAERGMAPTIRELAARAGMPIQTDISAPAVAVLQLLPADAQLQLFRIIQEAVSNTVKHSRASSASIRVRESRRSVEIEISDDGRGFDLGLSDFSGLGLSGMRDRASLIGARLSVHSQPGSGTRVRVWLPSVQVAAAHTVPDRTSPQAVAP
jgi:signal transduction histidine kinase